MYHPPVTPGLIRSAVRTAVLILPLIATSPASRSQQPEDADDADHDHYNSRFTVCKRGCRYDRIQRAVDAAKSGATILVGPGTYFENVVIDRKSVTLEGVSADKTTVDGRFRGPVFVLGPYPEQGYAANLSVTLTGLTITHGRGVTGGGIVQNVLTFAVTDSVIVSNVATQSGGGIESEASSITPTGALTTSIENCVIAHNRAPQGAGIFVEPEVGLRVTDSLIADNTGGDGAGVFAAYASNVVIVGTTVSNNISSGDGGGIWIAHFREIGVPYTSLSLERSAIVNNTAANSCGGVAVAGNFATTCRAGEAGVVIALNQPGP
jgi:hypothetical protein